MTKRRNNRNSGLSSLDISLRSRNCQNENTELEGLEAQKIVWKMGEKIKDFEVVKWFNKKIKREEYDTWIGEVGMEEQIFRKRIRRLNY